MFERILYYLSNVKCHGNESIKVEEDVQRAWKCNIERAYKIGILTF